MDSLTNLLSECSVNPSRPETIYKRYHTIDIANQDLIKLVFPITQTNIFIPSCVSSDERDAMAMISSHLKTEGMDYALFTVDLPYTINTTWYYQNKLCKALNQSFTTFNSDSGLVKYVFKDDVIYIGLGIILDKDMTPILIEGNMFEDAIDIQLQKAKPTILIDKTVETIRSKRNNYIKKSVLKTVDWSTVVIDDLRKYTINVLDNYYTAQILNEKCRSVLLPNIDKWCIDYGNFV